MVRAEQYGTKYHRYPYLKNTIFETNTNLQQPLLHRCTSPHRRETADRLATALTEYRLVADHQAIVDHPSFCRSRTACHRRPHNPMWGPQRMSSSKGHILKYVNFYASRRCILGSQVGCTLLQTRLYGRRS